MEIFTVPRRVRLPPRWRVLAGLAVVLPVTVFALVPIGLGLERYVITNTSMAGTLERGTVVFEHRVPVGALRPGDVITFAPPAGFAARGLVTHRILEVSNAGLVTKGDANDVRDPWTLPSVSQSRVVFSVPYVGHAFIAEVDRRVWMLVIIAPLTLALVLSLARSVTGSPPGHWRAGLRSVPPGGPR